MSFVCGDCWSLGFSLLLFVSFLMLKGKGSVKDTVPVKHT